METPDPLEQKSRKIFKKTLKNPLTTNAEYGKLSTESKGWHYPMNPEKNLKKVEKRG